MSRLIEECKLLKDLNDKFQSIADINAVVIEQPTIHAIPIEKVKKAREEISDYNIKEHYFGSDSYLIGIANGMDKAVEILDKLIAESEVEDGSN